MIELLHVLCFMFVLVFTVSHCTVFCDLFLLNLFIHIFRVCVCVSEAHHSCVLKSVTSKALLAVLLISMNSLDFESWHNTLLKIFPIYTLQHILIIHLF